MSVEKINQPVSAVEFRVQRDATRDVYEGTKAKEVAVATYDVSGGDTATVGTHGLGVYLPDNAVVTSVYYDVVTTFTDGADDSATIALGLETQDTDAFLAAAAISAGGNPFDAGIHRGIQDDTAANAVKTTAERQIVAVVADDTLTAGKMNIFVEYFVSD